VALLELGEVVASLSCPRFVECGVSTQWAGASLNDRGPGRLVRLRGARPERTQSLLFVLPLAGLKSFVDVRPLACVA
jgi:hypothetical protein